MAARKSQASPSGPSPRWVVVPAVSAARARSLRLGFIFVLWIGVLLGRLYYLQVISYFDLTNRGQRQQDLIVELTPDRGVIYDRSLEPLAMSVDSDSIFADPAQVEDHAAAAEALARALDLDRAALLAHFDNPQFFCHSKHFCWLKRKVPDSESKQVHALNLKGIGFQKEKSRFYPKGTLASQVLGYVGMDDKGLAGMEYSFNQEILGRPGKVMMSEDARHHSFLSRGWESEPGKNVVLTIDGNIQFIAEKALAETVEKFHAAGGTVIVEDPNSAEILAIANIPTLNANDFRTVAPQDRINRAVGWVYEPGSTFKLITISAAIESRLTHPSEVIDCQMGSITLSRHVIHDHKRFGALTVADVLAHSSDVGSIKLGLRLGEERFYHYIRSFGFGSKTGAGLPGEERGLIEPPSRWSGISIGEISIGQEVGVTPLQLTNAYAAIANGGVLFKPRLVREVFRGNVHEARRADAGQRVVSPETAAIMRQMLAGVVDHGTGMGARLNGYSSGGKTGTAQKIDANGHYSHSQYVASFAGIAPAERPAVAILVVVDTPVGQVYGAEVAGPAFKFIAEQTLSYLKVPHDRPTQTLLASARRPYPPGTEDTQGHPAPSMKLSAEAPSALGDDADDAPPRIELASEVLPGAGAATAPAQGTLVVDEAAMVAVPDLSRLAVRQAVEKCQRAGLDPIVHGSGLEVQQTPSAGSRVAPGSPITLDFAR